jgi:hypothetical protein
MNDVMYNIFRCGFRGIHLELSDCAQSIRVSTSSFVINRDSIISVIGSTPFDFTLIILARLFSIEFAYIISIISRGDCDILMYTYPVHPPPCCCLLCVTGQSSAPKQKWEIEFTKCLFLYDITFPSKKFR